MGKKKIVEKIYPYKAVKKLISGTSNYAHYIDSLLNIKKNRKRVAEKIKNGEILNVIFLIQFIPGWNKLEPIFLKMKDDVRINPVIVCVPLNIQDHELVGMKENDTYQYFVNHGYESIDALQADGSWYDLKHLEPDYVFHSRPYNGFMPECYTSWKIVKYALICNVLYGPNLSKNVQNVTLAKNYYRDCFCYFSFDEIEKEFYSQKFGLGIKLGIQKCMPYGAIAVEQILIDKKEITNNKFRKTVMWTPRWSTDQYIGGSTFLKYRTLIRKLVEDNPDIFFIFRPHPLMFENFLKTGEMSPDDVNEFRNYCAQKRNLLLDEAKQYSDRFYVSNILITDASGIIPEFFALNKPIIYCGSSENLVSWAQQVISSCYQIKDEKQLEDMFYFLVEENDPKRKERQEIFDALFNNVEKSSSNITEFLVSRTI